jgi:hypothetical protein
MLVAIVALILVGGLALWLVVALGSRGGDAARAIGLTDLQPSDSGWTLDAGGGSSTDHTPAAGGDSGSAGAGDGSADCGSTFDGGGCDVGGGDGGGGGGGE